MSILSDELLNAGYPAWANQVNQLELKYFERIALLLWASNAHEIVIPDKLAMSLPSKREMSLVEYREEDNKRTIYSLEVRK